MNFIHLKKYPDSHWRPHVYSMKPGSSRAYAEVPSIDIETKTFIKCMVANFCLESVGLPLSSIFYHGLLIFLQISTKYG